MTVDWYQMKLFVEHASGVSMDALHVLLGVAIQISIALLIRRPLSSLFPWTAVLAVELLNEWNDLRVDRWPDLGMQLGEGAKDAILTMVLPTVLLLTTRLAPGLFGSGSRPSGPAGYSGDALNAPQGSPERAPDE